MSTATPQPPLVAAPHDLPMLIGGEARAAANGATMTVRSPATGETVGRVPSATLEDVTDAIPHTAFDTLLARTMGAAGEVDRFLLTANAGQLHIDGQPWGLGGPGLFFPP